MQAVERADVGALGGAVGIDHFRAAIRVFQPGAEPRDGDRFAAEDREAQRGKRRVAVGGRRIDERIESARRAVQERDAVVADQRGDARDVVSLAVVENQGAAGDQRGEEIFLCEVEAWRADDQRPVARTEGEFDRIPVEQIFKSPVIDRRRFRLAGGARGENRVDQVVLFRMLLGLIRRSFGKAVVVHADRLHVWKLSGKLLVGDDVMQFRG